MVKDIIILILIWIIMIAALLLFIPKHKIRNAVIVFLFKQTITWPVGLLVVQWRLIQYPVRLLPYANRSSFTFEYFVYPAICALFNVHFPEEKGRIFRFGYYIAYCSALTLFEVLIEHHTNLIVYLHWSWFWTWVTLFITFFMSRVFYLWFMRRDIKTAF